MGGGGSKPKIDMTKCKNIKNPDVCKNSPTGCEWGNILGFKHRCAPAGTFTGGRMSSNEQPGNSLEMRVYGALDNKWDYDRGSAVWNGQYLGGH